MPSVSIPSAIIASIVGDIGAVGTAIGTGLGELGGALGLSAGAAGTAAAARSLRLRLGDQRHRVGEAGISSSRRRLGAGRVLGRGIGASRRSVRLRQ